MIAISGSPFVLSYTTRAFFFLGTNHHTLLSTFQTRFYFFLSMCICILLLDLRTMHPRNEEREVGGSYARVSGRQQALFSYFVSRDQNAVVRRKFYSGSDDSEPQKARHLYTQFSPHRAVQRRLDAASDNMQL